MTTATDRAIATARVEALADSLRRGKEYTEDLGPIARDIQFSDVGEGEMKLVSTAVGIPLWNRATGEQSYVLTDQLKLRLSQRFPRSHPTHGGQLVYTEKAMEPASRGILTCLFHADNDGRKQFGARFQTLFCTKSNLPTESDVDDHVRLKHPSAWKAREKSKERAREDRQMALMQAQVIAMEAMAKTAKKP